MSAVASRELWTPDTDSLPVFNAVGRPDGQVEYAVRTEIRDLVALHGFDDARAIIAAILIEERNRRPRQ